MVFGQRMLIFMQLRRWFLAQCSTVRICFATLRIAALKCMEACPVYSVAGMGKGQNGKGHGGKREPAAEPRWVHLGPWEVDEGFTLTAADRDRIRAEYDGCSVAVRLRSFWGERAQTVSGPENSWSKAKSGRCGRGTTEDSSKGTSSC